MRVRSPTRLATGINLVAAVAADNRLQVLR